VVFESKLENIDFSIAQYGNTDFRLMNGSFIHEVYEKNMVVASFQVGPENPDFVALDQISPYLKFSVLTSEDGDFFYHRGFNEKAFRESISKNIKENRFARGGSTITMQLVKNVFLNRKKIISRKIEEALIVWIIENMHLTSKDRMFEVYLNIIEWGPGIYGINKASEFYFNKHPRDLNLSESIYLTSLIPRPKGFKYTFDNNGQIRDYMKSYYQLVSGIMVRRNQILPEDTINLQPISKLTGEARNFLLKPDSTNMEDSLFFIKPIGLIPQDFIK
jgi:membrane peptidoglycan carboxypeptidase